MRSLATLGLASISSLLVVGCARNPSESSASQAVDSSSSVESEGNVMMAAVDSSDMAVTALTSDQVAANIAAHVFGRWQPASCATVSQPSSTSVVIKLADCTGPRGLVHVTGELDLSVSVSVAGVITVAATATALEVNRATLDINATATYSTSGASHVLTVQSMGTGTGALGNAIDHTGDYTLTWDATSQCGSVAGMWSTTITGASGATASRSETANVNRCASGCPTGSVVRNMFDGATLTVTFDGSATAAWMLSTGASGTINLGCH
jgi:hypothetical protein